MNETAKIVDTWFKHQHEEIIEKLKNKPTLQLEYVTRVLNDKKDEIASMIHENEWCVEIFLEDTLIGKESEEYKRYHKLLTLNVELLCDYRPDEVMVYIKEGKKWYPTQLCLEICKRKNNQEAVAFLLKRSGAFTESLNCYLGILTGIGERTVDENQKNSLAQNAAEFKKYFEYALKVCVKHAKVTGNAESEQGLWFVLLDYLYDQWLKMYKQLDGNEVPGRNVPASAFSATLNDCIKKLLSSMMVAVSFPTILTRVTEAHGELELESFKQLFTSMLNSYFYQEKILETAKNIVGISVARQFHALNCYRTKGVYLRRTFCSKCKQKIPNTEELEAVVYTCGHVYHARCIKPKEPCSSCATEGKSMHS